MNQRSTVKYGILVVAKAPYPGKVKTRLMPPATAEQAAEVAAASLLDTLDAARSTGAAVLVALSGTVQDAVRGAELGELLSGCVVVGQRGNGLAERLANAHADAAAYVDGPLLQIGMDTPQVTANLLRRCAEPLRTGEADAVLGPATDGGWWALGLAEPERAGLLRGVPMSTERTGAATLDALRAEYRRIRVLPELTDVDTVDDVAAVWSGCRGGRFARAAAGLVTPTATDAPVGAR